MTGDPLDREREAIEDAMDAGGDFLNEPVGKAGIAALDALVEVARAARNYQRYFAHDTLRGTRHALQCDLAAALARLDGPR